MDKYQRILEAAITVFAEQGYFQSTVAQIAKEAGVADGTIYLYFKNKDDILVQFYKPVLELAGANKPGWASIIQQRRITAPAERVGVGHGLGPIH